METFRIEIPNSLNELQKKELISRIGYFSELISNISINNNHIVIQHSDSQIFGKNFYNTYNELVENIKSLKIIPPKITHSNIEESEKSDYMSTTRINQSVHSIEVLNMIEMFTSKIIDSEYAIKKDYPIMLDSENMKRNKYHLEFPQNIMVVGRVPHNLAELGSNKQDMCIDNYEFKKRKKYLRPCICYSAYNELKDTKLVKNLAITSGGKCFRNELEWKLDDFRKEEFYMKEIIFIGTKEFVLETRKRLIEKVWNAFNKLSLVGRIETASDPFFYNEDFKKGTFQKLADTKYELIGVHGNGETSLASFNFCGQSLCKAYNIRDLENDCLYSGCVAFGLDRWVSLVKDIYGEETHKLNKTIEELKI